MSLVVDASVAIEFLLRTELGRHIASLLDAEELVAPELLDVEVVAVLRRLVLARRVAERRAREALGDLHGWDVARVPHRLLLAEAWRLRDQVSAYDAMYVATARLVDGALLTADGPLARAPALGVVVHNARGPGPSPGSAHDRPAQGRAYTAARTLARERR
jgi:predicted nucleic acid-binding protein